MPGDESTSQPAARVENSLTLRDLARWPERCHEEVTRRGQLEPCDKPAVAARYDEANSGGPYPVCARHARAPMVLLAHLLAEVEPLRAQLEAIRAAWRDGNLNRLSDAIDG